MATNKDYQDQLKLLKQLTKQYEELTLKSAPIFKTNDINQVNAAIDIMDQKLSDLEDSFTAIDASLKESLDSLSKSDSLVNKNLKAYRGIEKVVVKLKNDQLGIEELNKKQLLSQQSKLQSLVQEQKSTFNLIRAKGAISEEEGKTLKNSIVRLQNSKRAVEQIKQRIKEEEKYENALGITGATAKGLKETFSKIGLGAISDRLGIDSALENAQLQARQLTTNLKEGEKVPLAAKLKLAGGFIKDMGVNLLESLGPIALIAGFIAGIVKSIKSIDSSSGEIAKSMGVSAEAGRDLVASSHESAMSYGDLAVNTKEVVAAQMELNGLMGTAVAFSGEFAAEYASIQKRTQLSAEAMGFFAKNALSTNSSIGDQVEKVTSVTNQLNSQNGLEISKKQIQEDLANISKAQLLTAERNTKELAKQVFEARKLGVEMSEVEAIANSLLDFESSIQAEMEAELLTGKQLNLERARAAALEGDLATVAAEVANQLGSAAEFSKMNVIQQQALAESVGMSREELAGALANQEDLNAASKAGQGLRGDQMDSLTNQEKMNSALEKMKELFVSIAVPLMEIITPVVDMLVPALQWVVEHLKMIGPVLGPLIGMMGAFVAVTKAAAIFTAIKGIWTSLGSIPFAGPALAAGAIAGAIGYIKSQKMKDGVIGPGGEMVVSGPKGSIQLDKDDSIIAGTDLGGKKKSKKSEGNSGNINLAPLVNEMSQVKAILQQILQKEGSVYMDGSKVGYTTTLADSKMG